MSFRPTVAVSWAESVLLGNFSITFWWITAPGGNRVFFLRCKSVSPGKLVILQGRAEARCEKCAVFLVFLCFCSGEGRAEQSSAFLHKYQVAQLHWCMTGMSDAGYIPCRFSLEEKLRRVKWQPGNYATEKSSFLNISCAWLIMV